jgi:hypothetical protein
MERLGVAGWMRGVQEAGSGNGKAKKSKTAPYGKPVPKGCGS